MTQTLHDSRIAVVGPAVGGKGMVAKCFVDQGYHAIDTGQLVRDELHQSGNLSPTREDMHYHAGWRRRERGGGYFIQLGMQRMPGPHLADGLRSVAEVEAALELGFIVIAVAATEAQCYQFACLRGLPRDLPNRGAFAEMHRRDRGFVQNGVGHWVGHGDPYLPATDWVIRRAQAVIVNDGSVSDLRASARRCFEEIQAGRIGPGQPVPRFSSAARQIREAGTSASTRAA